MTDTHFSNVTTQPTASTVGESPATYHGPAESWAWFDVTDKKLPCACGRVHGVTADKVPAKSST